MGSVNCENCQTPFDPVATGRRKYCTLQCMAEAAEKKSKVRAPKVERQCDVCPQTFITQYPHKKYCSPECQVKGLEKVLKAAKEKKMKAKEVETPAEV